MSAGNLAELCSSYIHVQVCDVTGESVLFILLVSIVTGVTDSIGYHSLHGSIMGCSLRVTRAGVAGQECEC